jgi:hypothetical protein
MFLAVAEFYPPTDVPTELFAGVLPTHPGIYLLRFFPIQIFTRWAFFLPTDLLACWVFSTQRLTCWVCPPLWPWWVPPHLLSPPVGTNQRVIYRSKGIEVRVLPEWHFQWLFFSTHLVEKPLVVSFPTFLVFYSDFEIYGQQIIPAHLGQPVLSC